MGLPIDRAEFREEEYGRFAERLRENLAALKELLARERFGEGPPSLGAELEMSMVSPALGPLPINQKVLADTADPRFTVELNRYNLECNTLPTALAGAPFSSLGKQLDECLTRLRAIARRHGARIALIGILPTLTQADLESSAMTNLPRFRALSNGIRRLRRKPFHVRIGGEDPLDIHVDDVTYEGANTSLQIHLRVQPGDFAAVYNAVQLATAPALALAVNSPTFLGHRLWDETRIALFQQSVDDRPDPHPTSGVPRVCFGLGWLERGALELFERERAATRTAPARAERRGPAACHARRGRAAPGRAALASRHRLALEPRDLRSGRRRPPAIEMRALPAGPTVVDMIAEHGVPGRPGARARVGLGAARRDGAARSVRRSAGQLLSRGAARRGCGAALAGRARRSRGDAGARRGAGPEVAAARGARARGSRRRARRGGAVTGDRRAARGERGDGGALAAGAARPVSGDVAAEGGGRADVC